MWISGVLGAGDPLLSALPRALLLRWNTQASGESAWRLGKHI